jgi:hypothetical protein
MDARVNDNVWRYFIGFNGKGISLAMTQKGIRVTTYMSSREKSMLEKICETTGENMSQVLNALVMQEFYRLKLNVTSSFPSQISGKCREQEA